MKTFLKVVAWIGAVLLLFSIVIILRMWWVGVNRPLSPYPTDGGTMFIVFIVIPLVILASCFMLIGGSIGKPKYFWLASLSLGVVYLAVFNVVLHDGYIRTSHTIPRHIEIFSPEIPVFCVGPGLIAIVEGILLAIFRHDKEKKSESLDQSPSQT